MRVIPVLDLMAGHVVHGIAGQRHNYQPIHSSLVDSADPVSVALAFRQHFELSELYLADLDAIMGGTPAITLYKALLDLHFRLNIDAGLRTAADAVPFCTLQVQGIVAGLETLEGPTALRELINVVGPARLVFSLDLKAGRPLLASLQWKSDDPFDIALQSFDLGVCRLLVLDLARVGMSQGTGTEVFCAKLRKLRPSIELIAGGGVRGRDDLHRLEQCGVDAVLVASALHDGRLQKQDWK